MSDTLNYKPETKEEYGTISYYSDTAKATVTDLYSKKDPDVVLFTIAGRLDFNQTMIEYDNHLIDSKVKEFKTNPLI